MLVTLASVVRARHEPVSDARLGDQVAGATGIRFQLAAQVGDMHAKVVGLCAIAGPPYLLQELTLSEGFPALRTSVSSRCHSVGVKRISS